VGTHLTENPIFKFLVEQSPDGQFVVVDGAFVYLNAAAAKMFSFDGDDPTELKVVDVLHPSEHERALRNMALRASGVLRGAAQYLARHKDGTTFPVEVHAAPLKWDDRSGLHGVIRDITARRKMEETLERMERTSVVSRLASGLAHDFNNLLAVIQSSADVARRFGDGTGELEAAVERIEAAVKRGSDKVRQIQQMAGQRAPSQEFRPLHINPVVEDVLDLTRARWQDEAESKGISYDVQWEPGTPPAVVGSPSDLRAALVALVFNAVEASPDGGTLAIRTGETKSGEVLVTVRDTGDGIADENLSQLTDAMFTTRRDRQMGLGLHLVQSVLQQHGGRLEVDSRKGVGSTFAIIIPAAEEPPVEDAPAPRDDLLARGRPPTVAEVERPPTRHGRSVLLIDDQADLLQVVRTILEGRGYDVDTAKNGREGVAAAMAQRYSVILTDLGMPDISGWEVAARIREKYTEVPIILMTGWASDIPPERLKENKIQALLPKPFRSDHLLAMIQQILEKA